MPERARKYPSIPEPVKNKPDSMYESTSAMKESVELLTGARAGTDFTAAAVTWSDLVSMGLISPAQIPR